MDGKLFDGLYKMISIRVSRLSNDDVDDVLELIDDETAKLTELQSPFQLTNAQIFVIYNTYGARHNGKLVGVFEIKESGELSYIVHRNRRREGIATEMLKLARRIAHKQLGIDDIYCSIHKENIASLKTAQKLGFNVKYYG